MTFNPAGLGLKTLTAGNDFIDNTATNTVLTKLNTASITLRSQASAFGANLSIVQIRQDFNKNLINVLQTGSSSLTLADSNVEAANSQALSTRQSIATPRCRSPTSRSRACCSCCADLGETFDKPETAGLWPRRFLLVDQSYRGYQADVGIGGPLPAPSLRFFRQSLFLFKA